METTNKIPKWFWVVSIIALIWNLMGVMAYLGQAYITDEALAALPEADQNFYNNIPAWVTAAFATSVFLGVLGCIGLLLKRKWAFILLLISLIAVVAQATYNFFIQDFIELSGDRVIMPIVVIIISIFLVWFSKYSKSNNWIS
ncbi:hypothetical protein U6A24_13715 [Aquimarina gracilis]|uniref:Sugar transporter n=1 Tax=Aquimarina gracilis TaxID=874422 RepID=A0ABU5ZXG8_9FLAO|nr:hypothetical protein [Aquimarina gracilis]MEB3346530.1 hypothetical protein [Aquimarina gracilis]